MRLESVSNIDVKLLYKFYAGYIFLYYSFPSIIIICFFLLLFLDSHIAAIYVLVFSHYESLANFFNVIIGRDLRIHAVVKVQ